jgi:hypothetical protein
VDADAVEGKDYELATLLPFWELTSEQDWDLCENNQAGVNSSAFTPGPYSTKREYNVIRLHGLVPAPDRDTVAPPADHARAQTDTPLRPDACVAAAGVLALARARADPASDPVTRGRAGAGPRVGRRWCRAAAPPNTLMA